MRLSIVTLTLSTSAFASHPHDRVCVGNAEVKGASSVPLIFQWEIERTYQQGNSADDPHQIVAQASVCIGDYQDLPCEKLAGVPVTIAPKGNFKAVPMKLKKVNGDIYFSGTFNSVTEVLTGKIGATAAVIKLNCVSQPRLTLDINND